MTRTVTILRPDGQTELRRCHPVSGKLTLLQVGDLRVECDYDDDGELPLRIRSSTGVDIGLDYHPDRTISRLTSSDGKELTFRYNEHRKPVLIGVKGVGEMTVSYQEDGSIAEVASSGGSKVALEVTAFYQKLRRLVALLQEPEEEAPEPSHREEGSEGLPQEADAAQEDGAGTTPLQPQ